CADIMVYIGLCRLSGRAGPAHALFFSCVCPAEYFVCVGLENGASTTADAGDFRRSRASPGDSTAAPIVLQLCPSGWHANCSAFGLRTKYRVPDFSPEQRGLFTQLERFASLVLLHGLPAL